MTPGRRPEFGVFTEFSQAPGVSEATAFVLAAPLAIAAALAGRTSRIKLGIAVQVLPLSHPLHIAEDVATASPTARAAIGQRLIDITDDEVLEEFAVYGTPEAVTDRLLELREALGYSTLSVWMNAAARCRPSACSDRCGPPSASCRGSADQARAARMSSTMLRAAAAGSASAVMGRPTTR